MNAPTDLVDLAQRFDADRRHLRSVALHLLGSAADADDAVQSAWLKASRSDVDSIKNIANLTGWFTTINPDNLSPCAAPSLDPSKRLEVPGEYWRPRRKPRAQELKIRKHADPSCVSRIVARR